MKVSKSELVIYSTLLSLYNGYSVGELTVTSKHDAS